MLPLDHPDRIQIAFDDHRLVANAGLLLPVTLAQHLGLRDREHTAGIAGTYRAFADVERFAHVADLAEIEGNDFNLNISRYVDTAEPVETLSVAEALAQPVKPATFTRSLGWSRPSGDSVGAGSRSPRCQCPRRPTRSRPAPGLDLQVVCVGTAGPRHAGVAV